MTVQQQARLTLAAIAREAGVSAPTVSKVINGRHDVSVETRAKVLAVLARTGYKSPLQQRRTLADKPAVEVAVDSLDSAYNIAVLNGVMECAVESDIEVLLNLTGIQGASPVNPEQRAQRIVDEGRCGMIVVTSAFGDAPLDAFHRRGIPVVVIDPLNPPSEEVVSIGSTDWAGGKDATTHLLGLGHRRIAYLGGPDNVECNQARLHGYLAALRSHGVSVEDNYIISGPFQTDHGARGLDALLQLDPPPTAIFAGNDTVALGVLAEARRRNIRIPEDLSVVGFDGTSKAEESVPSLTSVAQPLQEIGRAALRTVLRQLRGEVPDSRRVELATHLVVRESTAAPR
ncbi:LacI family DNA-binding transcriptional regulator [Arthrobacter sp. ISL-48]|uniref:LacI family DNA-binding transcriptional regulator n=1 Tax=Arthrobacter sp. ISL-48 TaxID=2819110 RepID=UPI001BEB205B|nr:LacI family DNA-binding transcriptional regulator [Arthrobacter sp. ISL-48]MBT2534101.1 LacI family DNA-binding transcriptional regulator [Arthrobacter sp. ISL-48]